jgi:Flp pilus assembly protein CpaB
MAQSVTTTAGSRVNRRFLFLAIILGVLAAVLYYAGTSGSGDKTTSPSDVPVVVASTAIPPGTRITQDMVQLQDFTEANAPFQAIGSLELVVGQVARYPINQGEPVLGSKLVDTALTNNDALSYVIAPSKRAMSINFSEVIGVDGLVLPGDHVDVLWIPFSSGPTFVLLSDIEVTAVKQTIVDIAPAAPGLTTGEEAPAPAEGTDRTRTSDAAAQPEAGTAALLLTPEQAVNLLCAENFADNNNGQIRLALRSFGDTAPLEPNAPVCPPMDLFRQFNPGG